MTKSASESAVVVEVAEVGNVVDTYRKILDPSSAWGLPAHVTLLYPFLPPTRLDEDGFRAIERALSRVPAFEVTFRQFGWFGEKVLWLAPEPDRPFREMTTRLVEAFPEYPPYEGLIVDPIPHLTVGEGAPVEALRGAATDLHPRLPIITSVTHVNVMTGSIVTGSWKTVRRIRLAG